MNVTLKSKTVYLTDGLLSQLGGDVNKDTVINADNRDKIADGLADLIGVKDDTTEPYTAAEANRDAFKSAFGMSDDDLAKYDALTNAGKKEVALQLVDKLKGSGGTVGDLADGLVADLGSDSTLEKFAETQWKLEKSEPTNGSVSSVAPNGNGLDIGVNLGSGNTAVTPAATDGVKVWAVDKDGNKTSVEGGFANGKFTTNGALPDGTTAIQVEITDENGYKTATTTNIASTTLSAGYSQMNGASVPNGNLGGDTGVFSKVAPSDYSADAEQTLNEGNKTYGKIIPGTVTYASGSNDAIEGKANPATTLKQEAEPDAGAYVDGFYVTKDGTTTKVTIDNATTPLGDGATLTVDATTGKQTLEYVAGKVGGEIKVESRYRYLLGEINTAGATSAIADVLADPNYESVFGRNGSDTQVNAKAALDAYKALNPDSAAAPTALQTEALGMVLNEITEGKKTDGTGTYDVVEFNAALETASRYVKAKEAVKDILVLDESGLPKKNADGSYVRNPAVTAGSYDEAAKAYEQIFAAYGDATEGEATITTTALKGLMTKFEKAKAQLVPATFSVEIKPELPEGVSITAKADQPQVGTPAGAQTVTVSGGKNGFIFPQYGTDVTLTLPVNADYDIYVGGEKQNVSTGEISIEKTVTNVTENADVAVKYVRKDVTVPKVESNALSGVTVTLPVTGTDGSTTDKTFDLMNPAEGTNTVLPQAAGTDVAVTFKPSEGGAILPGTDITLNGQTYPVTLNKDGSATVKLPANVLTNASDLAGVLAGAAAEDKLTGMIDQAEKIVRTGADDAYDLTSADNNYTQESWEALQTAANAAKELANKTDPAATQAEKDAAYQAVKDAYNALIPQHTVIVPNSLTVPEQDGKPIQEGVVKDSSGNYYVADGVSLKLNTAPGDGQKLDSVTYTMNGKTATAYPAAGVITIPVITDDVTFGTPSTSDKGFGVETGTGALGDATGTATKGESGANDTYTVTPNEGSELTSVTVDGVKVGLPDPEELKAVLEAGKAADSEWKPVDAADPSNGSTYTVADVNGKPITFTKEADGKITATLPGLGRVEIEETGGKIITTVTAKGETGLNVGTVIGLDGTVTGADEKTVTLTEETIALADAKGESTGSKIKVLPATGSGGVTVDFGSANSGGHSVAATTTLKTVDASVDASAPVGVKVNGKDTDTVKYGSPVSITIPAPEGKEVSMNDTVTFGKLNGADVNGAKSLAELAGMEGVSVKINADGSATVTIDAAKGETTITGASITGTDKGTSSAAGQLAADKAEIAGLAEKLGELLTEAGTLESNDGALYDETTDAWSALFTDTTGLTDTGAALKTALTDSGVTGAGSADALLAVLNTALGKTGPDAYASVADAIKAIKAKKTELEAAIKAAKQMAEGVISVPDAIAVDNSAGGMANTDSDAPTLTPSVGKLNPGVTGGYDLVVGNVKVEGGYLPQITYTVDGVDKTFAIQKDGANYKAYPVNPDGSVSDTADENITVSNPSLDGKTFTATIPNDKLTAALGDGATVGNVTKITVSAVKQGVILPTAAQLAAGTQSGSTAGARGVVVAVNNSNISDSGDNGTKDTIPVSKDKTITVTAALSEDDYYGMATGSDEPNATIWHKELAGVEIGGKFYAVSGNTLVDKDGNALNGVTVAATEDSATLTIDPTADGFDAAMDYTTLQLVLKPTNSQYNTFKKEFADIQEQTENGASLDKETLAETIKSVEKLIAEASGVMPAPYALTQGNKDYLTGEVAQLGAYKDRLEAFYNAAKVTDGIDNLYDQIVNGMAIPVDPITDEKKATLAAMEEAIKAQQGAYDALTGYEKTLVDGETAGKLDTLLNALLEAQRADQTDSEKFDSLVSDIAEAVGNGSGISTGNADLIDSMIRAAEDMYAEMSPEDQGASTVAKDKLDGLKDLLNDYLERAAEGFAEDWLTTDYSGINDQTPGDTAYDNSSNRLDSDMAKEGYADRVLLAKAEYDKLSAAEKAAVDALFNGPTVTELYKETFPDVNGATIVPDETVADNFVQKYLSVNGNVITDADASNYEKILSAQELWNALTPEQQELVNDRLSDAKSGSTYPGLLKKAEAVKDILTGTPAEGSAAQQAEDFIKNHLTYDGSVITSCTSATKSTIKAAKSAWNALSDAAKAAVNGALTGKHKGQTYEALYAAANAGGGNSGGGGGVTGGINVTKPSHGTVTVNPTRPSAGDKVIITVTPDPGYELGKLIVKDRNGNELKLNDLGNGKYSYTQPTAQPVSISATFVETDATGDPYTNGVADLLNVEDHTAYLNGYSDGMFGPSNNMTRAEAAQMFYNLLKNKDVPGSKSFTDVGADAWYYEAVTALANLGIVDGIGDGKYAPERNITRAEFVTIAMRFATNVTGTKTFTDVPESFWAHSYITGATYYGWINGYSDGTFKPGNPITRAEVAVVVNRMLARSADKEYIDANARTLKTFPDATSSNWAYYDIMEATNSHDYDKSESNVESWKK